MDEFDIPIFKKTYELYKEFYGLRNSIARQDRYTIWQRCENIILDILENVLWAITSEPLFLRALDRTESAPFAVLFLLPGEALADFLVHCAHYVVLAHDAQVKRTLPQTEVGRDEIISELIPLVDRQSAGLKKVALIDMILQELLSLEDLIAEFAYFLRILLGNERRPSRDEGAQSVNRHADLVEAMEERANAHCPIAIIVTGIGQRVAMQFGRLGEPSIGREALAMGEDFLVDILDFRADELIELFQRLDVGGQEPPNVTPNHQQIECELDPRPRITEMRPILDANFGLVHDLFEQRFC